MHAHMSRILLITCMFAASIAAADSIVLDGKTLTDVIVCEGATRYFVATPADGKSVSVEKELVDARTVTFAEADARKALQKLWEAKAGYASASAAPSAPRTTNPEIVAVKEAPVRITAPPDPAYADGTSGYITYPAVPRERSFAGTTPQRRSTMVVVGSDTLPKIVLQNPGGPSAGASLGGGTMGIGGGGIGGVTGFGQGGFGGGGAGGGLGGGIGGGRGVVFSNISQLFSTIDDRLVGETPAVIGNVIQGGASPVR